MVVVAPPTSTSTASTSTSTASASLGCRPPLLWLASVARGCS